jgi:cytochrome c5
MTTYSYAEHDYEDAEAADLRAEARAERRRNAYHWCDVCHGHTGPGSPCAPDEPEDEPQYEETTE